MAVAQQPFHQFAIVVYLAVEDEVVAAVFVPDRLASPLDVDDRETAMTERGGARCLDAGAVRSAVNEQRGHPPDDLAIGGSIGIVPDFSGDAAHKGRLFRTDPFRPERISAFP